MTRGDAPRKAMEHLNAHVASVVKLSSVLNKTGTQIRELTPKSAQHEQ